MEPMNDEINPSWWEDVLTAASREDPYEPPELLSLHFERVAADSAVTGLQELVLQLLATVSSARLNAEDWLEPFTAATQLGDKRMVGPADLNPHQVALLARIAPLVERDDLRARVADVAWVYGDRSDVAMLDRAIDAYRAAPLTGDIWFSVGQAGCVGTGVCACGAARTVMPVYRKCRTRSRVRSWRAK